MIATEATYNPAMRSVALLGVLVAACASTSGNLPPRRTVAEAICHVGSVKDACRVYFQGNCDHDSLMRRSPKGGFSEGTCGRYGRFISEPAHPEDAFRDYFFDASGALVGMRWCGDMTMPCPSTAKTGTRVCQGWGDIPRCTLAPTSVYEGE